MRIAITGHRPNKLDNDYSLTSPLIKRIKNELKTIVLEHQQVNDYKVTLISGMALGIDTLWALLAIEMGIPLIAALPCKNQEGKWSIQSQHLYHDIINHSNTTVEMVSALGYTDTCMQERNEWMVDNSDILIAVWDGTNGGTYNCVRYARQHKKTIIILDPNDFR